MIQSGTKWNIDVLRLGRYACARLAWRLGWFASRSGSNSAFESEVRHLSSFMTFRLRSQKPPFAGKTATVRIQFP